MVELKSSAAAAAGCLNHFIAHINDPIAPTFVIIITISPKRIL